MMRPKRIACLHTAESNVAVYDRAAAELGLPPGVLAHTVRPELLAAAEQAGGLNADIASQTALLLFALCDSADAVLLTCSTLGPVVAAIADTAEVPIIRADQALAERAAAGGGRITVLCAVETTIAPTSALFSDAAAGTPAIIDIQLVPGAWALFKAGDTAGYLKTIAAAADAAYAGGATVVALAQSSMADAADLVTSGPKPLSSPHTALEAVRDRLAAGPAVSFDDTDDL